MSAKQTREPGEALARPRDAATLLLYRRRGALIDVLMGERHGGHKFMPNRYVFPGGRVDRGDARVRAAAELPADVAARLARGATPARARALAMAALRETFEETGLRLGRPDPHPDRPVPPAWAEFFATGLAPALDRLDYLARAVTPPYRPSRFNARFFMAEAGFAQGEIRGSGELLRLDWVPIDDAAKLAIPHITGVVLGYLAAALAAPPRPDPTRPVPLHRMLRGQHAVTVE